MKISLVDALPYCLTYFRGLCRAEYLHSKLDKEKWRQIGYLLWVTQPFFFCSGGSHNPTCLQILVELVSLVSPLPAFKEKMVYCLS